MNSALTLLAHIFGALSYTVARLAALVAAVLLRRSQVALKVHKVNITERITEAKHSHST